MYRFAVQILFFDCDQFILRTIANCAPFVEKIFVTYSPEPWSAYNKEARKLYKNPSNPEILRQSSYYDKIQLVKGVWDTEEDQRNYCLDIAEEQGFDYLIIQDADEFYLPIEFKKNLDGIRKNPNYDYYRNPWYYFWKDTEHVIVSRYSIRNNSFKPYRKTIIAYNPNFAINIKRKIRFLNKRLPNSRDCFFLNGLCYHLSYVLSDIQLKRKLKTWGHSSDFDVDYWYRYKWLAWNHSTTNIHPIEPIQWYKAEVLKVQIPKELDGLDVGVQNNLKLSRIHKTIVWLNDIRCFAISVAKDILYLIRKYGKS